VRADALRLAEQVEGIHAVAAQTRNQDVVIAPPQLVERGMAVRRTDDVPALTVKNGRQKFTNRRIIVND
jgi:hypothetical protein